MMGAVERGMKEKNVSMEVKRTLETVLSSQSCHMPQTWTWNAAQESRLQAVEMSYMWGACGVSRGDGRSNEDTHGRFWYEWYSSGSGQWSG